MSSEIRPLLIVWTKRFEQNDYWSASWTRWHLKRRDRFVYPLGAVTVRVGKKRKEGFWQRWNTKRYL